MDVEPTRERFRQVWQRTDEIFSLLAPESVLARPIALRHPFIFYVGHLPAFAWNHVCGGVLERRSPAPDFDEMFSRGIDPDVDDPSRCHDHPTVPARWPDLKDVLAYRDRVRAEVLGAVDTVAERASQSVMARDGRVLAMVVEHELMHQETLLYMIQRLQPDATLRPPWLPELTLGEARPGGTVTVPPGPAVLGAAFDDLDFGWDNEFPHTVATVPGFRIDATPVTNADFLSFVEQGGYERPELWRDEDRAWLQRDAVRHPPVWERRDGCWEYRTVLGRVPLERVAGWPVYVSQAEARAYARWRGGRLPSEAEFHRAAYGGPDGDERPYPWGAAGPTAAHGNFGFEGWAPTPVGTHPAGASAWGVHDLVGDGWEWTETPFDGFPGFEPYIPGYPGYSADFFDGCHYVLKGASWATDRALIRRSFRNWFQARYPYVFAKFRCVTA